MSQWQLFPHMIVRTTGFAWEALEGLRCDRAVEAARRLAAEQKYFDQYKSNAPRIHRPSKAVLSALKAGRPVPPDAVPDPELFSDWNRLANAVLRAEEEFTRNFEAEEQRAAASLRAVSQLERFREAVASSSPPVFQDLEKDRWTARVERQVGSYIQRLCAKNETMSFFGPINYGRCSAELPDGTRLSWSGPEVLKGRRTYAASWLVQGVMKRIAFDPEIAPWLVLRRKGFTQAPTRRNRRSRLGDILIRLGVVAPEHVKLALQKQSADRRRFGELLVEAGWCTPASVERALAIQAGREALPEGISPTFDGSEEDLLPQLVAVVDGARTLTALSEALNVELAKLTEHAKIGCDRGLLTHQLEIPAASHHPLDDFLERLGGLPGRAPRRHVAEVSEVLTRMAAYSGSGARDKVRLNDEVRQIAAERWSLGLPSPNVDLTPTGVKREQRGEGHNFYVDRLPMREECGGDLDLTIGGERAREIIQKMALPLDWMGQQALLTRAAAVKAVAGLVGARSAPFWKVVAAFSDRPIPHDTSVSAALAAAIKDPSVHKLDLAQAVSLASPESPLPLITSIDLLIGARDVAAWSAGEYEIVIGDVHDTALVWGWALQFHPQRGQVETAMVRAIGSLPRPIPVITALASRRTGLLPSEFPGPVVELGGVSNKASGWRLPFDDLIVESNGTHARLVSRSLKSEVCLYNGELESLVHTAFALPRFRPVRVDKGVHTPRLTVNGAVLQREQWLLDKTQVDALIAAKDNRSRLREAIRIWDALGIPEHVFAKLKGERKPVLVDLRSPLLLRVFINLLEQREGQVILSEMRPSPAQLWLKGAHGRHTCELRCTFFGGARG